MQDQNPPAVAGHQGRAVGKKFTPTAYHAEHEKDVNPTLNSLKPGVVLRPHAMNRQFHREGAAFSDFALHRDDAPLGLHQGADDRQAKTRSALGPASGGIHTIESVEDPGQVLGRDPDAAVRDCQYEALGRFDHGEVYPDDLSGG